MAGVSCFPAISGAQEAMIGDVAYETLAEAFEAAQPDDVISLSADVTVDAVIPVTKNLTLELNGHTLTDKVASNRPFRLSDISFTINGSGKMVIPEGGTASYGFVDFRDTNDNPGSNASLVVNNVDCSGSSDGGAYFMLRTSGQKIELNNVNVDMPGGNVFSVVNGYKQKVDIKIHGGVYNYNSTNATAGVFQAGEGSAIAFDGVTVNSSVGPVFEVTASEATFTGCTITNTATNAHYAACVAASNGATVNVKDCEFTSNYPLYVYNSGGTINVDGGTYTGNVASIKVDGKEGNVDKSEVNVTGGTFNGAVSVDDKSELHIKSGSFTEDVSAYTESDSVSVPVVDADGNTSYVVVDGSSDTVALVGTAPYASLADAFAAAQPGQTISLVKDVTVDVVIPVTKDLTLDLNGHTLTDKVASNRPFRLSDISFTINGSGKMVIPEGGTASYGFVDFRDTNDNPGSNASLVVNNVDCSGSSDGGAYFMLRTSGQKIELNNVNVDMPGGNVFSVVNGYKQKVDIKIHGGVYNYNSTNATAGVFQAGEGSAIAFDGVTVNSSVGPVFEVTASEATFTGCTITNTATNAHYAACVAASNGATVNVKDCEFTSNYPLYVYNSGGTINVDGGTYTGNVASIKVDGKDGNVNKSEVNVTGGTFNGAVSVDDKSELHITGGAFTDSSARAYCEDGYTLPSEPNADGLYEVEEDNIQTGVEDISSDEATVQGPVYNAQGVYVGESLEGLAPGLYVASGKKVFVIR